MQTGEVGFHTPRTGNPTRPVRRRCYHISGRAITRVTAGPFGTEAGAAVHGNAADIIASACLAVPPECHGKGTPSGDGAAKRGVHRGPALPTSRSDVADDRPSRGDVLKPAAGGCTLPKTAE